MPYQFTGTARDGFSGPRNETPSESQAAQTGGYQFSGRPRGAPVDSAGPEAPSWGAVLSTLPRRFKGSIVSMLAGMKATELAKFEREGTPTLSPEFEGKTPEEIAQIRRERTNESLGVAREASADMQGLEGETTMQRAVGDVASSLPASLGAAAVGVLTRNPELAAATMYPTTTGQSFADLANYYRDQGIKPEERSKSFERALLHARNQGVIESVTELLPLETVLKPGTPLLRRFLTTVAADMKGETLATLGQTVDDVFARSPEGMTVAELAQGLEEAGKQMPETWLTSVLMSGMLTGPVHAADYAAGRMNPPEEPPGPMQDLESSAPESPQFTPQTMRRLRALQEASDQGQLNPAYQEELDTLQREYAIDLRGKDNAFISSLQEEEARRVADAGGDLLDQELAMSAVGNDVGAQLAAQSRRLAQLRARADADAARIAEEQAYAEEQAKEDAARTSTQQEAAQRYEQQSARMAAEPGHQAAEQQQVRQRATEEGEARYQRELQQGEQNALSTTPSAAAPTLGDIAPEKVKNLGKPEVPASPESAPETAAPAQAAEEPLKALPAPQSRPITVTPEGVATTAQTREELGLGPEQPLKAPEPKPTLRMTKRRREAAREAARQTKIGAAKLARQAAQSSAASVANELPQPTEAQTRAGNYQKGHVRGADLGAPGIDLTFENAAGDQRRGSTLRDHYGYIKRTTGADGDQVDVFVNPALDANAHAENPDNQPVFVIDQVDEQGNFDEHKVMLGYPNKFKATKAYRRNYPSGWRVGSVNQMTLGEFKQWLKEGDQSKPITPVESKQQETAKSGSKPTLRERREARQVKRGQQYRLPDDQIEVTPTFENQGDYAGFDIVGRDASGAEVANAIVEGRGDGETMQLKLASVNELRRGEQIGQQLIERAYREAQSRGRRLVSDESVSAQQLRVYEALRRKGWTIEYSYPEGVQKTLDEANRREATGESLQNLGFRPPNNDTVVTRIEAPENSQQRPRLGLPEQSQALTGDEARAAAQPIIDELPLMSPEILGSATEAPAAVQAQMAADGVKGAKAVYDERSDTIYVFADAHESADDVVVTLLHEGVAHKGLRYLLGDEFESTMLDVADGLKNQRGLERVARRYGYDLSNRAQRVQAADEYVAELAESPRHRSLLGRLYDRIRAVLRRLGVVRTWSDNDIRELLRRSREGLSATAALDAKGNVAVSAIEGASTTTPIAKSAWNVAARFPDRFKKWFGDSKVVDENGEPLIVYHGTRAAEDFDEFSVDGPPINESSGERSSSGSGIDPTAYIGAHFSQKTNVANYFASHNVYGGTRVENGAGRVYPVYLKLQRPIRVSETELKQLIWEHGSLGYEAYDMFFEERVANEVPDFENTELENILNGGPSAELARLNQDIFDSVADLYEDEGVEMIEQLAATAKLALENLGYDGVIYDNEVEGGISYIAFDPTQIKSAIGNNGQFDSNDPRIQYRLEDEQVAEPDPGPKKSPLSQLHNLAATMEQQADYSPSMLQQAKNTVSDTAVKAQRALLGAIPRRYITDFVARAKMPSGQEYIRLANRMDGRRNELLSNAEPIGRAWNTFISKNKEQGRILGELMQASTLAGVDPSMKFKPSDDVVRNAKRQGDYRLLKKWWNKLDPEAQKIYNDVRNYYMEHRKTVFAALEARINATAASGETRKQLITMLRKQFEAGRVEGPYFPLSRFGDFWAAAKDSEGNVVAFSRFESPSLQNEWTKKMSTAGFTTDQGQKMLDKDVTEAVSPTFAAKVTDLVKKTGSTELADEIWQMYLATLPEVSMRKAFMHRKGRLGFSMDAIRAFGHAVFHGAHQTARLENMYQLEDQLNNMRDEAAALAKAKDPDQYWAASVYAEMQDRHEWAKNPQSSALTTALTGFGFAWYLGATPAAAFVNLTQTPMVALPVIGSEFGMGRATAALSKAALEFAGSRGPLKNRLRGDERKAFEEAQRIGVFEKTQAFDLAGLAEHGTDYSSKWREAANVAAWMFHKAEGANRQITFLAGYRLARQKGLTHEAAILKAEDMTWDSHFDYNNTNRPRYMRSGLAKVLFLFRNYSLNMTYRMARDLNDSLRGATPEQRKIARKRFGGMMMMAGLFSGLSGIPVIWTIARILESMFDEPDDPYDAQDAFYAHLADAYGSKVAMAIMRGPVDAISGGTVSTRVSLSLPSLWMREPDAGLEGTELWAHYLGELAGPIAGIGEGVFQASTAFQKTGDPYRALEYFLPKALKDQMKALRYMREGAQNYRGDPYMTAEDFSKWDAFLQATGFTPSDLQQRYDEMRGIRDTEARILNRRQALMDRLFAAARNKDKKGVSETLSDIKAFNHTNPGAAISGDSIMRSAASRAAASQSTLRGVRLTTTKLRYLHNELQLTDKEPE